MPSCNSTSYTLFFSFVKERSKINALPMKNKKASSFHEFARDTSDAWDIGDDEDEDVSSFQTLNSKVAKATAVQVLENHSRLRVKPERPQAPLSEAPTNCKVIKSNSDAHMSKMPGKNLIGLFSQLVMLSKLYGFLYSCHIQSHRQRNEHPETPDSYLRNVVSFSYD